MLLLCCWLRRAGEQACDERDDINRLEYLTSPDREHRVVKILLSPTEDRRPPPFLAMHDAQPFMVQTPSELADAHLNYTITFRD